MKTSSLTNGEFAGVTGSQFEEEFIIIGKIQVTWNGVYQGYRYSMNEIRARQQPNSALRPEGLKLRDAIAREMMVDSQKINIFASVGTCLDKKHGVDLFVTFNGLTVTIDLTMNPQKGSYKADVVVGPQDVQNGYCLAAGRVAWTFKNLSRPTLRA